MSIPYLHDPDRNIIIKRSNHTIQTQVTVVDDHQQPDRSGEEGGDSPAEEPRNRAEAQATLEDIRRKMNNTAREFAEGRLSRAQFNAIYAHYSEKRTIVERLLQRNPESDAWRAAAASGKTSFLRSHFEARPIYFLIFRHGERQPLLTGGKQPPNSAESIYSMLKVLWSMETRRSGVARKAMKNGLWMVLALGDNAFTLVLFMLQPSLTQINRVRDLHNHFERANRLALERDLPPERMVFTQRSLLEERS